MFHPLSPYYRFYLSAVITFSGFPDHWIKFYVVCNTIANGLTGQNLRRWRQFAKAENKKIEGEVRKLPTTLDKKSLPYDKICLCLCMIGET